MTNFIIGRVPVGLGRLDLIDHDDRYELLVDVPGVPRDAIDVSVDGGTLTVTGCREDDPHRAVRRFERRLTLPRDAMSDGITAHLSDGVLRITLPRGSRARQVTISGPRRDGHAAGTRTRRPWQRLRASTRRGDGKQRGGLRRRADRRARA